MGLRGCLGLIMKLGQSQGLLRLFCRLQASWRGRCGVESATIESATIDSQHKSKRNGIVLAKPICFVASVGSTCGAVMLRRLQASWFLYSLKGPANGRRRTNNGRIAHDLLPSPAVGVFCVRKRLKGASNRAGRLWKGTHVMVARNEETGQIRGLGRGGRRINGSAWGSALEPVRWGYRCSSLQGPITPDAGHK